MYSIEMVNVTDFTEEIYYKMQNVEPEKFVELSQQYYNTINESAAESAKNVKNGVKTIFAKIMANVFEDEDPSGNDGPLMIDLIVQNVFKHLRMKDLFSCRQVCKLWNSEASSFFRQHQRIIFYPESLEMFETFISFVKRTQRTQNLKNRPTPPPFSTYCFTAQYARTQFPRDLMQDFVKTCGQYVRKLEIFYPDDGLLTPEDFLAFFLSGMPNLESIHFVNLPQSLTQSSFLSYKRDHNGIENDNEDDSTNSNSSLPLSLSAVTHLRIDRTWQIETCWGKPFLQDLLQLMPNLIDFELWTWNSTTEDSHSKPYLEALSPQNIQKLQVLRPGSIGCKLGTIIADLGLKLKKLYLPVLNRNISASTIELLLDSQKWTLEEFQLNCSTMQDSRLLVFPRMEKLTSLHMIITYPWNNDYTTFTPPIDYNAQFPRLKVLTMELAIYNDLGFISYFFPQNYKTCSSCRTLEELDISFSGFRNDKFVACLANIFPNIKKLRLDGYGSRIFAEIFLHMQNLEWLELYLIYGFNVDDQMTGIPKEICNKIRKKEVLDFKLDEVQLIASLCSLKKLHTLAIKQKDYQAKFWPDAQCITDITAYFALSHMKQLRRCHIESVKFTEECRKNLGHCLEDCWLDLT